MEVRKCRQCGKIYSFIRSPFCPGCQDQIDDCYQMVRDYLDENPRARISQVAEKTEVPERIILYLIREGRLTFRNQEVSCERCRIPIESGRYCAPCLTRLQQGLIREKEQESWSKTGHKDSPRQAVDEHGMHIQPKRKRQD